MDCQTILKSDISLNKSKRIGRVVYVVEGNKTEIILLKKIFSEILGYTFVSENRDGRRMKFVSEKDKYSVIYVFNSRNSNISSINDSETIGETVTKEIRKLYDKDFKINNAAIFYLFDRDYCSNQEHVVTELINKYANSRDALEEWERQGLLLLSYPAVEAFICENLVKSHFKFNFALGVKLKKFLMNKNKKIEQITSQSLIKGVKRTHNMMIHMGIEKYEIDNFTNTNADIFKFQENWLIEQDGYRLISMLCMSFVDLGILNINQEVNYE